jgi:hypothetical protein
MLFQRIWHCACDLAVLLTDSVTVTWTLPTQSPNDEPLTSFTVVAQSPLAPPVTVTGPLSTYAPVTEVNVSGLVPAAPWFFAVTVNNSAGASPITQMSTSSFPCYPGGRPPASPSAVNASAGNGAVTVSWKPPAMFANESLPITGYIVTTTMLSNSSGWVVNTSSVPLLTEAILVTNLTNGVPYTFAVQAYSCEGVGSAVNVTAVPGPTPPGPVENLLIATVPCGARACTPSQLNVSWEQPADSGGLPEQSILFDVVFVGAYPKPAFSLSSPSSSKCSPPSDSASELALLSHSSSPQRSFVSESALLKTVPCCSAIVSSVGNNQPLNPSFVYVFGVVASSAAGNSSEVPTTPGASTSATVPSPPASVVVAALSPTAVSVTWPTIRALPFNGGSPVFRYDIDIGTTTTCS